MHPVTDKPRHVDFLELSDDKPVKVSLPVRTTGSSIGVMNGGKLRMPNRSLRVLGLPADLPEEISIEVSDLRIGQSVRIKGLEVPNVTFLEPAEAVVVGVKMARGASADAEEDEEEGEEGAAEEGGSEE